MAKSESLQLRLSPEEKQAFQKAAEISGLALSAWIRERLRMAAIRELEGRGHSIPFLKSIPLGAKENE